MIIKDSSTAYVFESQFMFTRLFCTICIYFQRYPDQEGKTDGSETAMNENQKLYYHRVGESQDKDVLVAEFPENPSWRMLAINLCLISMF